MKIDDLSQYQYDGPLDVWDSDIHCAYVNELSRWDAIFISEKTLENPHLEFHPPEYFEKQVQNGAIVLRCQWNIEWFIFESNYEYRWHEVSERWSLWLSKKLQWRSLWAFLMHKKTQYMWWKCVLSVTKNAIVQRVNEQLMDYEVFNPEWDFKDLIELGWPIHEDYRYFINAKLHEVLLDT